MAPTHRFQLCETNTKPILGALFDFNNSSSSQQQLSLRRIKHACTALTHRRGSPQAKSQALQLITISREVYALQFTTLSLSDLRSLETQLNVTFRSITKNLPTFPTELLYLPTYHGGLGFKRLSTTVNRQKLSLFNRNLSRAGAAANLAHRTARRHNASGLFAQPVAPILLSHAPSTASSSSYFFRSIIEEANEGGRSLASNGPESKEFADTALRSMLILSSNTLTQSHRDWFSQRSINTLSDLRQYNQLSATWSWADFSADGAPPWLALFY